MLTRHAGLLHRPTPPFASKVMDSFGAVRALANEKHKEMRLKASGDSTPSSLLAAARGATGIQVQSVPPEHPLLGGGEGALHLSSRAIYISNNLAPELAAFVEAHEFAHYWIETPDDPAIVPRTTDPGAPEEATPLGLRRVEAYSAHELRERYANVFAREFLLPRFEAKRLFVDEGKTAPGISKDLNLPIGLVHQQLAVALLLPETPQSPADELEPTERPGLDDSQRAAAEHEGSPLLVEAGPGTGKTRTLIARTEFLLTRKGVPAPSILALTFSNKAAREIRERVAANMPAAAAELWAGTFHAFGLEILRKFGHLASVAEPVRLLDQADALAMLEEDLPHLGLDHYLLLHEPLLNLRYVLGAISRAKDEVKSPADYAAAAARMADTARTEDDHLKAAKAAEVARVYRHYDDRMREQGTVDFSDLINRPVEIFRNHPEVRQELRNQYQHLLVDEYQDVNRASALLVKEIAGEGERLWAVGDTRQSIYRFRGAAPTNTRDFERDYPTGRRKPLKVNYRSRKEIVDAFGAYSETMKVGGSQSDVLEAKRGTGAQAIDCNVARDREAEIAGIAEAVERYRRQGILHRDQAVLCRVHGNLEKIAVGLEAAGVPVLYLGDLFERPEVSDLLALQSFAAEPHRGGLYRVAQVAPYRTSLTDVRVFLAYAAKMRKTPLDALSDIPAVPNLSDAGRTSLGRLSDDLEGVGYKTGPGSLFCHLLFDRGAILRDLLVGDTAADQQRRLALHQFLQFAIDYESVKDADPKRHLLDWVRRLEIFGDERSLREPPDAIKEIDAVRLMTIHASKGLEFKVVHLPALGAGMFPLTWRGQRCPLPEGMLPTNSKDDHKEEEECLFYVALSRARDHLSLSRAQRYSAKQRSNPSKALTQIVGHLPRAPDSDPTWTASLPVMDLASDRPDLRVESLQHDGRDIELYLGCPRRYLYQIVLGLSGDREDNGYVRFHRVIYRVLRWMGGQTTPSKPDALAAEFEAAWYEIGPHDHSLEALYRAAAKRILEQALARQRVGIDFGKNLELELEGYTITLPIDEMEQGSRGPVLRRIRTGRPPSKPDQRHLHAMMLAAGRQKILGTSRFEVQYMTTDDLVPISLNRVMDRRLADIRQALRGAAAGRFPPKPSDGCPRCAHYFICPALPL